MAPSKEDGNVLADLVFSGLMIIMGLVMILVAVSVYERFLLFCGIGFGIGLVIVGFVCLQYTIKEISVPKEEKVNKSEQVGAAMGGHQRPGRNTIKIG